MTDMEARLSALSPEKRKVLEALLAQRTAKIAGVTPYRAPESRTQKLLIDIWEAVLGRAPIGLDDNFFTLGGDSIHCIRVVARAREAGLLLTNQLVFANPSIAALSQHIQAHSPETDSLEQPMGPVALTPIQTWFFGLGLAEPQHWNQAVLVDILRPVRTEDMQEAIKAVLQHHDALQFRFFRQEDRWLQQVDQSAPRHTFRAVQTESESEIALQISAAQTSFDLDRGPMVAVLLLQSPTQDADPPARLLLAAHHLVVDAVSFHILLEDLEDALAQQQRGTPIRLPGKTASYAAWSDAWHTIAPTETPEEQAHWAEQLAASAAVPLELSSDRAKNMEASAASVIASLSVEETSRLQRMAGSKPLLEVILEALGGTLTSWAGTTELRVDLEGHGRDALPLRPDVSRTVGWFTSIYPIRLSANGRIGSPQHVPHGGSRYLRAQRFAPHRSNGENPRTPFADVMLNYLGSFAGSENSTLFRLASAGADLPVFGPRNLRPHVLQIVASVWNGQLRFEWRYSTSLHRENTIKSLAQECLRSLHQAGKPKTSIYGSVTPEDLRVLSDALGGEQ